MLFVDTLTHIRNTLNHAASSLDAWFDRDPALRAFRPAPGHWTADEVLEHVSLTNHFLLILIEKGVRKALELAQKQGNLPATLQSYTMNQDALDEVGRHGSFTWVRPEHMEPTGQKAPAEVRTLLSEQFERCQAYLTQLAHGEGTLYKTTMTVNALGKLDVYEYIYFLAKHAERHLEQLQQNAEAFERRG